MHHSKYFLTFDYVFCMIHCTGKYSIFKDGETWLLAVVKPLWKREIRKMWEWENESEFWRKLNFLILHVHHKSSINVVDAQTEIIRNQPFSSQFFFSFFTVTKSTSLYFPFSLMIMPRSQSRIKHLFLILQVLLFSRLLRGRWNWNPILNVTENRPL